MEIPSEQTKTWDSILGLQKQLQKVETAKHFILKFLSIATGF